MHRPPEWRTTAITPPPPKNYDSNLRPNGDWGASHCYAGFLLTWRVNAGALRSLGWPSVPPSIVIVGNSHCPGKQSAIKISAAGFVALGLA